MVEKENYWLNKLRDDFTDKLDGLKTVKTNEELKEYTKQLNKARDELLKHDEDFKAFFEANQSQIRLINESKKHEANQKVLVALIKADKRGGNKYHPVLPPGMVMRRR